MKYLKFILTVVIVFVVGGVLGYYSTSTIPRIIYLRTSIHNGPWVTNLTIGSTEANMFSRAVVATHGLLALERSEVIYYSADTDDEGRPLLGERDYLIEGQDLDTGWWSITVYGADDFLIPNEQNRFSYKSTDIEWDDDGYWRIYLAQSPKEGNWLPTGGEESIAVVIRLYNPGQEFYEDPGTAELPRFIKEGS